MLGISGELLPRKEIRTFKINFNNLKYNKMTIEEKAEKWDKLDDQLAEIYGNENQEDDVDLADIGEIAATAFGYLP